MAFAADQMRPDLQTSELVGIPPTLDCYYSLSSPWAYLGGPALADIVRRYHVNLVLKPYDFQAVVPHTGGIPLKTRPDARRSYHALELARWRDYLGLPLTLEPAHYPKGVASDPNWNKYPGWMVIAAQHLHQQGLGPDAFGLSHALLRALWVEEQDTSLPEVRVAVANANGHDGAALLALEKADTTQSIYRQFSQDAIDQGIFGSPIFVLNGERFWGQDRLVFVERALAQLTVRSTPR